MAYLSNYSKYPNALDELHSHITPEQFVYLLSVLSLDDSGETSLSLSVDTDDSSIVDSNKCSWSPSSGDSQQCSLKSVKSFHDTRRKGGKHQDDDNVRTRSRVKIQAEHTQQEEMISRNQLVLPLSKINGRRNLLQLSSFDSTHTMTNTMEETSLVSRYTATSKDSMMALQGATSFEESLFENIHSVQRKYADVPLPLVMFQEDDKQEESKLTKEVHHKSCSKLPACKKIVGKYRNRNERESRSSSVETVKAESLPDLDNPLVNIAGKIANEPVNRFPILKKAPFKKSHAAAMTSSYKRSVTRGSAPLDVHRIDQDIGRELEMYQDYKDVSEFFSRKKSHNALYPHRARKGISYLSRPVTNPLYKAYNAAGYQKSEDEMAFECIQMVCDDFNKWIASLASKPKISNETETSSDHGMENLNADEHDDSAPVIGPDFLIQILRTELELPESNE